MQVLIAVARFLASDLHHVELVTLGFGLTHKSIRDKVHDSDMKLVGHLDQRCLGRIKQGLVLTRDGKRVLGTVQQKPRAIWLTSKRRWLSQGTLPGYSKSPRSSRAKQ